MPQLPQTPSSSTGFTLVTDEFLRTTYRSSLGNIEFNLGEMYSNLPNGTITLTGTGTGFIYVSSSTQSTSTVSGALVVRGGVGIGGGAWISDDINVNGLTIGQGYKGTNNVVIQGVAVDNVNEFNEGRASVAIGFSALTGLNTALKSIAIGRYALSSGTKISNSIAIGDSALKNLGVTDKVVIGSILNVDTTGSVSISVATHNLNTGTEVYIDGIVGTTELNDRTFWVDRISSSVLALYDDNILSVSTTVTNAYISGGTLYRVLERNNNIAIGSNAGLNLVDGVRNFFFGDAVAPNFTTGSNNFFIGHEVATNMTTGSNNIAIGGDNLVDGLDDQVNIGSVLYYNGAGYLQLNADTGLGLGSSSTSTNTGALTVLGGVGLTENLFVGGNSTVMGVGTYTNTAQSTSTTTGALQVRGGVGVGGNIIGGGDIKLVSPSGTGGFKISAVGVENAVVITHNSVNGYLDFIGDHGDFYIRGDSKAVKVSGTQSSTSTTTGALQIVGGVGVGEHLNVGGNLDINGNADINSSTESTASTNGALVITGGVGVGGNLNVGKSLNVLGEYTATISPSGAGDVIIQTRGSGDVDISPDGGGNVYVNPAAGDVRIEPTLGGTVYINPSSPGSMNNVVIGDLPDGAENATVKILQVLDTTESTSTTTGAAIISGGLAVSKDVYSKTGNPDENYLLYTPQVFVTAGTLPTNPRIGDFWVDSTLPAYLQYIRDGTDTFWLQIGAV
jgi:hypothetical protein